MFVKPLGHAPSQRVALEENTAIFALRTLHRLYFNTTNLSADVSSAWTIKGFNPGALPRGRWPRFILIDYLWGAPICTSVRVLKACRSSNRLVNSLNGTSATPLDASSWEIYRRNRWRKAPEPKTLWSIKLL